MSGPVRAERADAAASKADRAEEARHAREAGLAEAERCNTALAEELARFAGLLGAVVDLPARTLPFMRRDVSLVEFDPRESDDAEPRPAWADFAPPERGVFGRWKYERAVAAARTAFDRASQDYDRRRAAAQEAARRAHEALSHNPSGRGSEPHPPDPMLLRGTRSAGP